MQEDGRVEIVAVVDEAVVIVVAGWQKLGRGTGGPPSKSLDSDENFKPEHTLFCRKLGFVSIYGLFGDLWAKKVPF